MLDGTCTPQMTGTQPGSMLQGRGMPRKSQPCIHSFRCQNCSTCYCHSYSLAGNVRVHLYSPPVVDLYCAAAVVVASTVLHHLLVN
jgi:hypothetical protein